MAVENVTITITPADLYDLARDQVEAALREPLLAEINRRWPDGLPVTVGLVEPTA